MHVSFIARSLCALTLAVSLGLTPLSAPAQETVFETPRDFSEMVAARLPSVVGILATGAAPQMEQSQTPQIPPGLEDFFGMPRPDAPRRGPMQSQGSGFIISQDGMVVTNNHVITGAEEIEVVLEDDRRFPAKLIGTDPATDIALLKVESDNNLPAVAWGDSTALEIGDWVVAIGNPFGLGGTVTAGIVSARSRNINSGPYDDFLQTDASINRGNSGGPLFDASGDVVGVNTAIFSPSGGSVGIGFAVPAHVASRIVEDLQDDGQVERGWLGVRIQPLDEEISQALGLESAEGILVAEVTPDSPAADAGLEAGDVITQLGDNPVSDPRDLTFGVADLAVGSEVQITYMRNAEESTTQVVIGQLPSSQAAATGEIAPQDTNTPRLGVSIAPMTPDLRAQLQIPNSVNGLALVGVEPGGPAALAGLRRGDVIAKAGGDDVTSTEILTDAIATAAESGRPLLLQIWRAGSYSFRAINLDPQG